MLHQSYEKLIETNYGNYLSVQLLALDSYLIPRIRLQTIFPDVTYPIAFEALFSEQAYLWLKLIEAIHGLSEDWSY